MGERKNHLGGPFLFLLAVLAGGCGRNTPPAPPAPAVAERVLIVTIDTLRADRVGVYGARDASTPVMDQLAREGAYAVRATVPAPLTRPSHASLFTGRYPAEHGVRDNVAAPLAAGVPVLAELFRKAAIPTAAFVSSAVLEKAAGLDRGFDVYIDQVDASTFRRSGDAVAADAIAWMQDKPRFFAWVHLFDVHAPYEPPSPYKERFAGRPYDGAVAWADAQVGRLIDALRQRGALDGTLVIVTSDHGESLGEHGEDWHGFFVYDATMRVPLIVRGPGIASGTRVDTLSRIIDLFPTVLDLTGLSAGAPATSGVSLAAALRGQASPPALPSTSFGESLTPRLHFGWSDLRSVEDGRWKYILAPRPELYDLAQDPGELKDLAASQPDRARQMRASLEAHLRTETAVDAAAGGPSAGQRERLGALGYVSRSTGAAPPTGADPKDKIGEYRAQTTLMAAGLLALNGRRPADAIGKFQALLRSGSENIEAHEYLARAYREAGRHREAASEYQRVTTRQPANPAAWRGLAEARATLRDAAGAAQAFSRLVAISPNDALAHMQLGEMLAELGRMADAAREMRAAVAIDPQPAYWNILGTLLGSTGSMPDAERAFAEAAKRDASSAVFAYNHAVTLERLGRRDEALAEYRRAAQLGSSEARAKLAQMK